MGELTATRRGQGAEARLFYWLASIAASQGSVDHALQQCLDAVCEYVGWPVGHLYVDAADGTGELAPTAIWHLEDPERFDGFRRVTERTRFSRGVGLPGRVLSSGEPAWIPDVQVDTNFPRNRLAKNIGVRGAFGFPVNNGSRTVAVLEFFTDRREEPDQHVLDVMRMVGLQFGRILERRQAEDRLRAAVQELEQRVRDQSAKLAEADEMLRVEIRRRERSEEEVSWLNEDPAASVNRTSTIEAGAPVRLAEARPASFKDGRYEVRGVLGEGARKQVYLVHDTLLDRDVAFALIKTEGLDETGRRRILREAQALARLGDHPNIVQLYDLGDDDGQPYMVMPVMSGGDVDGLI